MQPIPAARKRLTNPATDTQVRSRVPLRGPAGKWEMHVWHERAPEVTQEIDVPATGLANVDVTLDARGFKQVAHKDKMGKDYTTTGVRY